MSSAIMFVGATGTGKTYACRKVVEASGAPKTAFLVFDTNGEWEDIYPYEFDPDMDTFLEKAEKVRNAIIIIEDATSFFSVQGRSDKLVKILVAKRHTNNTIIMLFHSWGDVPRYLYRKCTHVCIFKTHDREKDVDKVGNQQIMEAWKQVQKECEGHKFFESYPPPKGVEPPQTMIALY